MKIIPVEVCMASDENKNSCHYSHWKIDTQNKRLIAVCDYEDRYIEIFLPPNHHPAEVAIPEWCPLSDLDEFANVLSRLDPLYSCEDARKFEGELQYFEEERK